MVKMNETLLCSEEILVENWSVQSWQQHMPAEGIPLDVFTTAMLIGPRFGHLHFEDFGLPTSPRQAWMTILQRTPFLYGHKRIWLLTSTTRCTLFW
jgi:hypothetical protein